MRRATQKDASGIRALVREARLNPFGLDWQRFLVAVPQGAPQTLLGCVQVKTHGMDTRELASLVVAREVRGQGIARTLIEACFARAGRPLWLMCAADLTAFYERFGFKMVREGAEMAPYFRRIHVLYRATRWLFRGGPGLAIMVAR